MCSSAASKSAIDGSGPLPPLRSFSPHTLPRFGGAFSFTTRDALQQSNASNTLPHLNRSFCEHCFGRLQRLCVIAGVDLQNVNDKASGPIECEEAVGCHGATTALWMSAAPGGSLFIRSHREDTVPKRAENPPARNARFLPGAAADAFRLVLCHRRSAGGCGRTFRLAAASIPLRANARGRDPGSRGTEALRIRAAALARGAASLRPCGGSARGARAAMSGGGAGDASRSPQFALGLRATNVKLELFCNRGGSSRSDGFSPATVRRRPPDEDFRCSACSYSQAP